MNLNDTQTAYAYKTTGELRLARFVYRLLQYPTISRILTTMATWVIKYRLPFTYPIRATVYKLFCAGENEKQAMLTILRLNQYEVKPVLDYVAEGEMTEAAFDSNCSKILENIRLLGFPLPEAYVSVKLTSLEDKTFLSFINSPPNREMSDVIPRLERLRQRLDKIGKQASQNKVIVYFDAEDRCMQDLFDDLVEELMERYNKNEVLIFNTLQMYLNCRMAYLEGLISRSGQMGYLPGIKLVRGAYLEAERLKALKEGAKSPVFSTKEETDASFNKAVEICLRHHHLVSTCVATHNEQSVLWTIECMERFNVPKQNKIVRFSQLYGMSDGITFNLARAGFNTSKYLPYGEVEKAIPYLIRRAEENTSVNGQMQKELLHIEQELKRRSQIA